MFNIGKAKIYAKEFEQYIISGFREECLDSLVPGGEAESYLRIVRELSRVEKEIPDDLKNDISSHQARYPNDQITLLFLLKEYDLETTTNERKAEILDMLKMTFMGDMNFNFPKPSHYDQSQGETGESIQYPSKFDESTLNFSSILDDMYTKGMQFIDNTLSKKFNIDLLHHFLDITRFTDDDLLEILNKDESHCIKKCFQKFYLFPKPALEKLAQVISSQWGKLVKDKYLTARNYMERQLPKYLTTEQIEVYISLLANNPDLSMDYAFNEIINRRFTSQLARANDRYERRKVLVSIYENLKLMPLKYKSMRCDILLQILENGTLTNIYDKVLFKEYLENPIYTSWFRNMANEKLNEINFWNANRQEMCGVRNISSRDEEGIIGKYLKHFFIIEKASIDEFIPNFQNNYLMKEYCQSLVLRGEEDEKIIQQMNTSEYEALVKKTEINICEFNKEHFNIDDPVIIDVDVKNVQTLFVKIFEINTENYYYTKQSRINSAISLEGLIATYEETFSYSDKPQRVVRRSYELNKIPLSRGIYVIEFIGNGISSRALIKKGGLSLIHRSTNLGKILYILDEDQNVCVGPKTGIWVKEQFYQASPKGDILIPYSSSQQTENIIILHDNFAELDQLVVETENYSLNGVFILNEESILMGNTCKVLIRPYLFVNGRYTDIKNLTNIKVNVFLAKFENEQTIPINHLFENLHLTKEEDLEIEFQIPPRLTEIKVTLSGDVKNLSKDTTNHLEIFKQCHIQDPANSGTFECVRVFLRKHGQDYFLELLGKNGEPKANVQMNITTMNALTNAFDGNKGSTTLQTNSMGEVFLGKMKNVIGMQVQGNYRQYNFQENIVLMNNDLITYPNMIDIVEGQELTLPIVSEELLTFLKYNNNNTVIENLTNQLIVQKFDGKHGRMILNGLTEGMYVLCWNFNNQKIVINVHKGKLWENEKFIITPTGMIENAEYRNPICIEKLDYVTKKENERDVKYLIVKVNKDAVNPRIHIQGYKYFKSFENETTINYMKMLKDYSASLRNTFSLHGWNNIFLSNRILNEEIQYVFDRKQYERFMGNTLEKPSLLVKRQFVRNTTTDIQEAKKGTEYKEAYADVKCRKMKECEKRRRDDDNDYYFSSTRQMLSLDQLHEILISAKSMGTSTFHNFLECSPLIINNLKPDENGEVTLKCDFSDYSIIHAIALDLHSCYEESLYLDFQETKTRDLTLTNPLNSDKSFSELRKATSVPKGTKHLILDITSTNFKIIDSLDKYLTYVHLTDGRCIQEDWKKFNFLLKFDDLNIQDKLKNISTYFCHELNILLYFKHHDFFVNFIQPIIRYKSEKTFVDYFLLGDEAYLNEYASVSGMNGLNAFEKCLLIYAIRKTNPAFAKAIAKKIRTTADSYKQSPSELKRLFNVIMNMKIEDSNVEGIKAEAFGAAYPQPEMMARSCFAMSVDTCGAPRMMANKKCMMMKTCAAKISRDEMEEEEDEDYERAIKENIKKNIFKEAGKSKEYCETHYYNQVKRTYEDNNYDLFLADLADFWVNNPTCIVSEGFISTNLLIKITSFRQLLGVLSVLDLPAYSMSHQYNRTEGRGLEIIPASNIIVFTKEISETQSVIKPHLMIAQVTWKEADKSAYTNNNNEKEEEDTCSKQYLTNEVYRHETIVTNISSEKQIFEILMQIPEGSLPIGHTDYTRTENISLEKFQTVKREMHFYFPKCGKFRQYPPAASIDGVVVSKAQEIYYEVVDNIVKLSRATLDDVLESGTKKEIIEFIEKSEGIKVEDLPKIYWLLKDKDFFMELIRILRMKCIFEHTVWSFGLYHKDPRTIQEFLESPSYAQLKSLVGPQYHSSLFQVDDSNNFDVMNHKDYYPILNSRVHRIAQEKNSSILNVEFKQTYQEFITYLITLKYIDAKNYIRLCYYLILQDRIEDAIKIFERIDTHEFNENFSLMLQYDYITAYLDFSTGFPEFKKARELCSRYTHFPLNHWRDLFTEIKDQLDEFDGKEEFIDMDSIVDEEKKKKQMSKQAAQTEPKLQFTIEQQLLNIIYTNISSITVKLYLIDLEILFSRTPFIKQNSDDFSFVIPNFTKVITTELSTKENILKFPLPDDLKSMNLFIEVSSISKKCFDTYFSTTLICNISEEIGEIKVLSQDLKPLTKVYIKCFARINDESVKFYKDGYTDLRGRFNYVALNTNQIQQVKKFALFAMSDELGSIIKECNPPSNLPSVTSDDQAQPMDDYDKFQNYRQELKNVWKASKKQK